MSGGLVERCRKVVGHAWERSTLWPAKSENPALEWAKAVIAHERPSLDAAQNWAKSETYVICGNHAAAVRDAQDVLLAATEAQAATITALRAEVVKKDAKIADLSNALAMSKAYVRKLQHRAALERPKP